jgi:hypothetical protein
MTKPFALDRTTNGWHAPQRDERTQQKLLI